MMRVTVLTVRVAPSLKRPVIVSGIRDRAAAQAWGEKNGHAVVYYLKQKQRAYADQMATRVDQIAGTMQKQSEQLLKEAEKKTMTTASSAFTSHARTSTATVTTDSPRIMMDGRMTIMKLCQGCGVQMPHEIGKKTCLLCELEHEPASTAENPS